MQDLIPLLLQFKELCTCLMEKKPFVFRTPETLSLHFDPMTVQSEMRRDAPVELILPYTQTMMGFLLLQPEPESIAMIGLGGGSLAKYCHATLPRASIIVTEINPDVIALRDEFSVPRDDERFQVICADGADFVRAAAVPIDVLLVDGYDRHGQSPQLCSQAFYDDCYRRLSAGGVIVVNLPVQEPTLPSSVAGLRGSFGEVVVVDSEDHANFVAFACKRATLGVTHEQLCARLGALEREHQIGLRSTLQRIRYEQYKLEPA
jgi:spermidine synthase